MLVTFISQCEKKALNRTRRVLDAFAERIGDRTWQTLITEAGLVKVKYLLRQTVTKNTAVACHWRRGRNRNELLWIVGNRRQFNAEGVIPVNSTRKNILKSDLERSLPYIALIKALVAVAALLHDWGKATLLFQNKLTSGKKLSDPLRHEWISCLLLQALVQQTESIKSDKPWLSLLAAGALNESELVKIIVENNENPLETYPLKDLPPLASLVAWLILTHHRLPFLRDELKRKSFYQVNQYEKDNVLAEVSAEWGYANNYDEQIYRQQVKECFNFPQGLLSQSKEWMKGISEWANRLLDQQEQAQQVLTNGCWRLVLQHARLCLMLGDHYYSSCNANKKWQTSVNLYANTDKDKSLKQKLDEHLVNVKKHAIKVCRSLTKFTTEMDYAHNIRALKQKSPPGYEWQDLSVSKITRFRAIHSNLEKKGYGWFIINMASTGCGKTIANAKVMRALSKDGDSLRYVLALGLRTLTLQTGDEYRNNLGLSDQELAVLIGSAAVKALHESANNKQLSRAIEKESAAEQEGSESAETLLDEDVNFDAALEMPEFLNAIIPEQPTHKRKKNQAFLYAPVLTCTIDHMMAATETIRGGKYMLPYLRLLSSDLVIDEVDDFNGQDLIAIGRLVHLAGMLGRKVMLSSATIPPALAEGFFNAYQAGWQLHSQFHSVLPQVACAWIDEYSTTINFVEEATVDKQRVSYQRQHQIFIEVRVKRLLSELVRRKGFIVRCEQLLAIADKKEREESYFEIIKQKILVLHAHHATIDSLTGKKVSFGVVRVANILPNVNLSKYLLQADWLEDYTPKIMAYHSQQTLLLRHVQEQHLDDVLKRKEKPGEMPKALTHPIIRDHLNKTNASNIIFILVATPVEEIGRDHDFDWAIIEPSSYRSIIQLVGRVRRHRVGAVDDLNVAIMQYNLNALANPHEVEDKRNKPVFWQPGYETYKLRLAKHDLVELINEQDIAQSINAIPRIQQPVDLNFSEKLADLEHQAIINSLKQYNDKGPDMLQGWLTGAWWLTALPQQINPFRSGYPTLSLYYLWQDDKLSFYERDARNDDWVCKENTLKIKKETAIEDGIIFSRLWLSRNYQHELREWILKNSDLNDLTEDEIVKMMEKYSKQYGEISIPENYTDEQVHCYYSDQFGLIKLK